MGDVRASVLKSETGLFFLNNLADHVTGTADLDEEVNLTLIQWVSFVIESMKITFLDQYQRFRLYF